MVFARRLIVTASLVCGGVFCGGAASADDGPASSLRPSEPPSEPPSKEVARDLLEHATASLDEGAYKEACDYYRAALKIRPSRGISCSLGLAARLSGNPTEAMQALTDCLAEPLPPLGPNDERERMRRVRFRSDLEVVRLQTGAVEVTTTPGAEVVIDDVPRGVAPLSPIFVLPGTHSVEVRDRRGTARESVAVGAGKRVSIELEPKAPTSPPRAQAPAPIPVLPSPVIAGGMQPVVVAGAIVTGLAYGAGMVTLTASQIINLQVAGDNQALGGEAPNGCVDSTQAQGCVDIYALKKAGMTLQTVSLISFAVGAVAFGGTLTYASTTPPTQGPVVSVNAGGFTIGWRGTW